MKFIFQIILSSDQYWLFQKLIKQHIVTDFKNQRGRIVLFFR